MTGDPGAPSRGGAALPALLARLRKAAALALRRRGAAALVQTRDRSFGNAMSRQKIEALAAALAAPVLAAGRSPEGLRARMPVETGPAGAEDRGAYSALEALGRLLCGLAPLLERQAQDPAQDPAMPQAVPLADVHHLLAASTDMRHPHALNFTRGTQPLVDAAFLAQAVLRAPTALWTGLAPPVQDNLAAALRATRAIQPHFNNWLLFSATVEAAFCRLGLPWDPVRVDYALRQHEQWYAGDGLYADGPHFRWDYYNSYVIQPMLLDILDAVEGRSRAWDRMRPLVHRRAGRCAEILERLIGPDGSFPPIGRSLAYRCGAFHLLAQLALRRALPARLAPAQVRCALAAVIDRTLGGAGNRTPEGWLRIGLNAAQPAIGERYISTGSLYLCSTAFLPLGLPPEDPFWADPDMAWTQRRLWTDEDAPAPDKALDK
jgi:hypothetical protein